MSVKVTWLEGHSLAQTVFTNLFLHDPMLVEDRTLKTLCIGLLRIVAHIRDAINKACVFEEVKLRYVFTLNYTLSSYFSILRLMGRKISKRRYTASTWHST